MSRPQVRTGDVNGANWHYLGELGTVTGLTYSDSLPGGNTSLACTLITDTSERNRMLDPGRRVQVMLGGSRIWRGTLDEPSPDADGWKITAQGNGVAGTNYRAEWTSYTFANVIDNAIGRGLNWVRGSDAGGYTAEPSDSGSQTVTDFLNAYTSPGSKTWQVDRNRNVSVFSIPTKVTRLLVATSPAVRTLAGYKTALCIRYQISADTEGGAAATYGTTWVTNDAQIAVHGRIEEYWDISDAGVMTATAAQNYGKAAMAKYDAASWGGPFQVNAGQYLTVGGAPVDLAAERAGEVVRLLLADGPYGGEVVPSPPITFPVGQVDYNDDDGTLTVTPFQSSSDDWAALLDSIAPKPPA
jgi:hypothetical protein